MRKFFTLAIFIFPIFANSQAFNWDSLRVHIASKTDTAKIAALYLSAYNLSEEFPDSAIFYGKSALSLSVKSDYLKGVAESHNNIGAAFITLSLYDSAVNRYQKAMKFYDEINEEKGKAVSLNNLGHIEQERGNYEKASEYLLQSMEINERIGNEKLLASNFINLGIVLSNIDRVDEAIEYYRKAIPIKIAGDDYQSLGNIYNNIGIEFRKEKLYDSALRYHKLSVQFREKANAYRDLAASRNNLGILYYYLGKQDSTLLLFKDALETYKKIGDQKEMARSYFNIAELYRMQGKPTQSLTNLEFSLEQAKNANSKEQIRDALLGLARVNASNKNFGSAYDYRIQYELYKDSLMNDRNSRSVLELTEKYESEKKDKQITQLELDNQISALQLAKSENQRNVLIAVSFIVIIVAVLLFVLFRQKRKSLTERDILLKEIHHRVKNNLQVISSLLNLQADSLDDDTAKDAVKEGQHRVKSMALIHQKLYSADDVRGVNVQGYLEQLSTELFKAFGVDNERVGWKIDTSGLKLDIDTVIPLGLIINELITNSIKYAFQNVDHGLLEISMKEEGDSLNVFVKDNGAGMDEEAMKSSNSFGWKMIKSLSRKLKAEIFVSGVSGTSVQLKLARYKLVL
jgi:two-component system, sensor histidine kinase PdtaS